MDSKAKMLQRRPDVPKYRRHKATGQAVVTLSGKDFYLGPHGTKASIATYDRKVEEWLKRGRTLGGDDPTKKPVVVELANAFRKSKAMPASHVDAYMAVMKILVEMYGRTPIDSFGPVALMVVRERMVAAGWKRNTINGRVHNIRRIFRWGVAHEMVSPLILDALRSVEALTVESTNAPESTPTQPVDVAHVEQCIKSMTPTVAAMVRLQMYSGMRAGELVQMRTADIDTSDPTAWIYRPVQHKTKHHGKIREIAMGPKAIDVLRPLLLPDLQAPIFSPVRADQERRSLRTAARKTPAGQGNAVGTNVQRRPKKAPGHQYDTRSYRQAIDYSIERTFPVPAALARAKGETRRQWQNRLGNKWAQVVAHYKSVHWHPHQLRHTFSTLVVNQFTAEHTQRALGHSNLKATQIYAKLSLDKAKEVARAIG